jgi:histone H3/H4
MPRIAQAKPEAKKVKNDKSEPSTTPGKRKLANKTQISTLSSRSYNAKNNNTSPDDAGSKRPAAKKMKASPPPPPSSSSSSSSSAAKDQPGSLGNPKTTPGKKVKSLPKPKLAAMNKKTSDNSPSSSSSSSSSPRPPPTTPERLVRRLEDGRFQKIAYSSKEKKRMKAMPMRFCLAKTWKQNITATRATKKAHLAATVLHMRQASELEKIPNMDRGEKRRYSVIRKEQRSGKHAIPGAPFKRLVRQIAQEHSSNGESLRFTKNCFSVLRSATENIFVDMFRNVARSTAFRGRVTSKWNDLYFVLSQNPFWSTMREQLVAKKLENHLDLDLSKKERKEDTKRIYELVN